MKSLIIILAFVFTTAVFATNHRGTYEGSSVFLGLWGQGSCKLVIKDADYTHGYTIKVYSRLGPLFEGSFSYKTPAWDKLKIKQKSSKSLWWNGKVYFDMDGYISKVVAIGPHFERFTCRSLKVDLGESLKREKRRARRNRRRARRRMYNIFN